MMELIRALMAHRSVGVSAPQFFPLVDRKMLSVLFSLSVMLAMCLSNFIFLSKVMPRNLCVAGFA